MNSQIDPLTTARELATHANDIKHLQDDMDKLVRDMDEIKRAIQNIDRSLSEVKGGRKTLFMLLSAAGAVGSFLTWFIDRVFLR